MFEDTYYPTMTKPNRWHIVEVDDSYYQGYYFTTFRECRKCCEHLNNLKKRVTPKNFDDYSVRGFGQYAYGVMDKEKKVCHVTKKEIGEYVLKLIKEIIDE